MTSSSRDTFTLGGATRLANKIKRYWKQQGHEIAVWVEQTGYVTTEKDGSLTPGRVHVVRSNLVNGMPRGSA